MENNKKNITLIISIVVIILVGAFIVYKIMNSGEPKEVVYLNDNEVNFIFKVPDNYKNKYIKVPIMITEVEYDKKGRRVFGVIDIQNNTKEIVVYVDNDSLKIKKDDCILIDGYITGSDNKTLKPYVYAKKIELISYKDASAPTIKESIINKKFDFNDVSINIEKVEFAKNETRIYLNIKNITENVLNINLTNLYIMQNNNKYEQIYSKNEMELSNNLSANEVTEGIIVFSSLEQESFDLNISNNIMNITID